MLLYHNFICFNQSIFLFLYIQVILAIYKETLFHYNLTYYIYSYKQLSTVKIICYLFIKIKNKIIVIRDIMILKYVCFVVFVVDILFNMFLLPLSKIRTGSINVVFSYIYILNILTIITISNYYLYFLHNLCIFHILKH